MFNRNEHEIKIRLLSGLSLAAKTWGNPENSPLIALHGWLDNANSFLRLADLLKHHFYVVALDFIGHGHSDHLPDTTMYHYIESVEHVLEVAEQLKFKQFSLLGHSLGAGVAPLIAASFPEKISRLFLLEGLGPLSDPETAAVARLRNYIKHMQRKRKNKAYDSIEDAVQTRMRNSDMTYASARLIVERGIHHYNNAYFWRHDPRLLYPSPTRFTESQVNGFLDAIDCPTTLIIAENGYDYGVNLMSKRAQLVKDIETFFIPGGHHAHMDYPKETADIIFKFHE